MGAPPNRNTDFKAKPRDQTGGFAILLFLMLCLFSILFELGLRILFIEGEARYRYG
jgi:hypothetical protein